MGKVSGLVFAVLCITTVVHGDMPRLVVYYELNAEIGSLQIFSTGEWGRVDMDADKIEELREEKIFCSSSTAFEEVREEVIGGFEVTVKMLFPAQERGRSLNETTRFELLLYQGDRLFFHSCNFGQLSEQFTAMPEWGVKFRPQSLSVYSADGQLHVKVSGVYGEPAYEAGTAIERGFCFDSAVQDILIDDEFMNGLATTMN